MTQDMNKAKSGNSERVGTHEPVVLGKPDDAAAAAAEHTDIAHGLYLQSLQMDPDERDMLATRVRRKIDLTLLPFMAVVSLLSYMDKGTLNQGSAYGLRADLHMSLPQYSLVASAASIGYLLGCYPCNLLLQKLPIGKTVAVFILIWGILLVAATGVRGFGGLMALRLLLGFFESCVGPAWMLTTSMFWTRDEQALRMCIWLGCNGLGSIIGAGLSWGLGHTHNPHLSPWQLIFLTMGVISIFNGLVAFWFLPSSPLDFVLFSEKEKMASVWRVRHNKTGVKHAKIIPRQIKEAIMEPRVWLIAGQQMCVGLINGGFGNFLSALLSGFGYAPLSVTLYQIPNGAFQFVSTVAAGIFVSRVPNTKIITSLVVYIPPVAGVIGIATISLQHRMALTACCWLLDVGGAALILNWSIVAANFAGHTKRTTVNTINFVFYATGSIVGPFMYRPSEAPRYMTAIRSLIGVYAALVSFTACIGLIMWRSNKKRDAEAPSDNGFEDTGDESGFLDLTDHENRAFRYTL